MSTSPFDVNKPPTSPRWYHEVLAVPVLLFGALALAVRTLWRWSLGR